MVQDEVLWKRISEFVKCLKPITTWITRLESNKPTMNLVIPAFHDISNCINAHLAKSLVFSAVEAGMILNDFQQRKEFALAPIHFAAHLLDPRRKGTLAN